MSALDDQIQNFKTSMDIVIGVASGDATTTVQTPGGSVPSVKKLISDSQAQITAAITNVTSADIGGALPLQNAKPIRVAGSSLVAGDTDLYTVPAGRRCYLALSEGFAFNPSAASVTIKPQVKVGGTYYPMASLSLGAGTGVTGGGLTAIVLEAGEVFSINASGAGVNVRMQAVEFDAATPFHSPRLYALTTGYNTLYTVPTGKSACYGVGFNTSTIKVGVGSSVTLNALMWYAASSPTLTLNSVPSGGTAGAGTQMSSGTAGVTNQFNISFTSSAGDALVIQSSADATPVMVWANVWEINL